MSGRSGYFRTPTRYKGHGTKQMKWVWALSKDQKGATAIEYGLIAALIAVASITAMSALGTKLSNSFNKVSGNLK